MLENYRLCMRVHWSGFSGASTDSAKAQEFAQRSPVADNRSETGWAITVWPTHLSAWLVKEFCWSKNLAGER